jgi:uncharacterized protein
VTSLHRRRRPGAKAREASRTLLYHYLAAYLWLCCRCITLAPLARGRKDDSMPVRPAIDVDTAHATRAFIKRVEGRYPVRETILYGSRARNTHRADSDADLAVILSGPIGNRKAAAFDMAGIAFDVLLETGILVEALPLWEDELDHPERFSNPELIENIRREGLRL